MELIYVPESPGPPVVLLHSYCVVFVLHHTLSGDRDAAKLVWKIFILKNFILWKEKGLQNSSRLTVNVKQHNVTLMGMVASKPSSLGNELVTRHASFAQTLSTDSWIFPLAVTYSAL